MENKKAELLERIEELREKHEEKIYDLRPSSWSISDPLYDILNEVADDLEYDSDIMGRLDDIADRVYAMLSEDDFDDIDCELLDIEFEIENLTFDDDVVIEKIDNYFVYYSDAWEYLSNNHITDFEEAMEYGLTNVCAIATYYLNEEYWGL